MGKKILKSVISFIVSFVVFTNMGISALAGESQFFELTGNTSLSGSVEESNLEFKYEGNTFLGKIKIIKGETISINGIRNNLYDTFENQQEAIEMIKKYTSDILCYVAEKYNLQELDESNWNFYREYINIIEIEDNSILLNQKNLLDSFFDIYENYDKNIEILKLVEEYSITKTKDVGLDLAMLLPNSSEWSNMYLNSNTYSISNFDVDAAVNYAVTYACYDNYFEYGLFGNDCTNFASQILENGGVAQEVYSSEYSGWWHTISSEGGHSYSRSWTVADVFARYMGVGFTTHDNFDFSVNIQRGDFVALDFYDDGDWNHIGFVTDVDTDGPYCQNSTGRYLDYRIAQHTDNYWAWASSVTNGWDNYEGYGGKYGRVRR